VVERAVLEHEHDDVLDLLQVLEVGVRQASSVADESSQFKGCGPTAADLEVLTSGRRVR
jgi:hypothetical protein